METLTYNSKEYNLVFEYDEEWGGYVVFVPSLPGCHTQGKTKEESIANINEALELYLEEM